MIWFEYKYISSHEILTKIELVSNYSIVDIASLLALILLTFLLIFYVIPYISLYHEFICKKRQKSKKKDFIRKINLQREIEDSIAAELNIK